MLHTPQKVITNTIAMTIAFVGQKLIAFVYFTILARSLGSSYFGSYFFALSFATTFSILMDLGLSSVLVRESARDSQKAREYISQIMTLKIVIAALLFAAAAIGLRFIAFHAAPSSLIFLAFIPVVLDSFQLSFYAILRGHQLIIYEAVGAIIGQLITLLVGCIVLVTSRRLEYFIVALMIGSAFHCIYTLLIMKRRLGFLPTLWWHKGLLRSLLGHAWPFALAQVFSKLMTSIDSVLIGLMVGAQAVGIYSVAYKLTYSFQFIPMALVASLYPAMSAYYIHDKTLLDKALIRAVWLMALASFPLTIGIWMEAKPIVHVLYGSTFAPTIETLEIMTFALPLLFLQFPLGSLLNATNHQQWNTLGIGLGALTLVITDLVLIPRFGAIGAAVGALIGNAIIMVVYIIGIRRMMVIHWWNILERIGRVGCSALFMGITLWFLNTAGGLLMTILAGIGAYGIGLLITKALTLEELRQAITIGKRPTESISI